jgi:hypothetical protein
MGYIDPQDRARQREEAAREVQDEALDKRRAELAEAGVRHRGIYRDERIVHLDDMVRVEMNNRHGHVSPHELAAAQERAREVFQPILTESPNMPLDQFKEIVSGINRPKLTADAVDARAQMLTETRTKVYETKGDRKAALAAVNKDLARDKPILNGLLKSTGAGNSVPLARSLMGERGR